MKNIFLVLLLFSLNIPLYSQTSSSNIFTNGDEINVVLASNSDYYYIHQIKKGQSLYALSKIFDVSIEKLYQLNQLKADVPISIGQPIKILLKDDYLYKGTNLDGLIHGHYVPVYYQTKPKDNLFRISRVYFNQSTADLVKRNSLESNNLSLGQKILIGWFPIDSSVPSVNEEEYVEDFEQVDNIANVNEEMNEDGMIGPLEEFRRTDKIQNTAVDTVLHVAEYPTDFNVTLLGAVKYSKNIKVIKKSEVANWDSTIPDNGMVYVLHKDAIIDSYIEMYNPMRKKSVRAKVIGRIPYGAYTNSVKLVLSPRAAKQLGALDRRFKVEMKALVYKD